MGDNEFKALKAAIKTANEDRFFTILLNCNIAKEIIALAKSFKLHNGSTNFDEHDILQVVMIKIWKVGLHHFKDFTKSHFEFYLRRTAKNTCLTAIKNKRKTSGIEESSQAENLVSAYSADVHFDTMNELESALRSLPPLEEEIIRLRLGGYRFDEIAQKLDKGLSNIKYHHGKALKRLEAFCNII